MAKGDKYYDSMEIAEHYGVSAETIRVWSRSGKITYSTTPSGRKRYLNPEWRDTCFGCGEPFSKAMERPPLRCDACVHKMVAS